MMHKFHLGGNPKIGGNTPKMDGENNGKPHFLMDDLGENPLFPETSIKRLLTSVMMIGSFAPRSSISPVFFEIWRGRTSSGEVVPFQNLEKNATFKIDQNRSKHRKYLKPLPIDAV